jgi:hypothetical protein
MTKALRLNVHPRVITLGHILERGERSFNELHLRDRMLLHESSVSLDGLVTDKEMVQFRAEMADEGLLPLTESVEAKAKLIANNGKQRLGIQQ